MAGSWGSVGSGFLFASLGNFFSLVFWNIFCQILQTHTWILFKRIDLIMPLFSFVCANLDLMVHCNRKVQFNASGCFQTQNGVMQKGNSKQIRFPRKCETSFVDDAFIHSLLTMRYSRFPPQIYYLQTIPMLDTSQFKMQFHLSHPYRPKADGFGIIEIFWSIDRLK